MTATIGKKELCQALGWSRPKLDRRLQSDPDFPVVSRGDQSGGWKFNLKAVEKHLGGVTRPETSAGKAAKKKTAKPRTPAQTEPRATSAPAAAPKTAPRRSAYHSGEATAKQRKDDADATLREMKVAEMAGDLVPAGQVAQVFSLICTSLASDLDALPEEIVRTCHLPLEASEVIRSRIDAIRTAMVIHGEQILGSAGL